MIPARDTAAYALNDKVLRWLEELLEERFGHRCSLSFKGDGYSLALHGHVGEILFLQTIEGFGECRSDLPCAEWDPVREGWHSVLELSLPAPGLERMPLPMIRRLGQDHQVHYDILGLTYWKLARIEELDRVDLDEHGRFPAVASHAYQNNYLDRPIVDEWLHVLGQIIKVQWPNIRLPEHRFCMEVSHDVDRPSLYAFKSWPKLLRGAAGDAIFRRKLKPLAIAPWVRLTAGKHLHPRDPANTFQWIMDLSEKHSLISSFYFMCGRTAPQWDADYEPEHPAIRELMACIHARSHKLGLHPSYHTFQAPALLKVEADRLFRIAKEEGINQAEWGGRMHYLRWSNPVTLRAWCGAGMKYDSSLGYADYPGFRCGTCFEYTAFDPLAGEALCLRIKPLIAMETTFLAPIYLGLDAGPEALARLETLKKRCESVRGSFTLLWHNCELQTPAERNLYRSVLEL